METNVRMVKCQCGCWHRVEVRCPWCLRAVVEIRRTVVRALAGLGR